MSSVHPAPRLHWLSWRVAVLVLLAAVLSPRTFAEESENLNKATTEWLKVRMEANRLQNGWRDQRQLLESMVNVLTERAQSLESKRDYLQAKSAKDREEIARLEALDHASAEAVDRTAAQLKTMDARLLQLRPSLPPRLSEALDAAYRSLAAADLTVNERAQLTLTILNRCVQFNRSITCEDEMLVVGSGGKGQLLEVIYWGLSHAYALDRAAGNTWYGSPGPKGWTWEPLPDNARQVSELIAVYRNKAEPDFVEVPARLKSVPGGTQP